MADTLKNAKDRATARLAATSQAASARPDAEMLLLYVTGISRADLLTHPERQLSVSELEAYFQAIERRSVAEPIQYITGIQEFYGLPFKVTPAVLIPRPETEHVVEAAIALASSCFPANSMRILDIGTGSGTIAVSLAHHLPNAQIVATDISSEALSIARENANRNHVADRICFAQCDLFPMDMGRFDMICSNPPYIADGDVLETQVAAYEPHTALFAGPTGLEFYGRIIPQAAKVLHPGGVLLLEIGQGQQAQIEMLLCASHLQKIHFISDLQAIPRVAMAHRSS